MKNKINKILVGSIFIMLILLILTSSVDAKVGKYFTKADIKWNSTKDNGEDEDEDADTDNSPGG